MPHRALAVFALFLAYFAPAELKDNMPQYSLQGNQPTLELSPAWGGTHQSPEREDFKATLLDNTAVMAYEHEKPA